MRALLSKFMRDLPEVFLANLIDSEASSLSHTPFFLFASSSPPFLFFSSFSSSLLIFLSFLLLPCHFFPLPISFSFPRYLFLFFHIFLSLPPLLPTMLPFFSHSNPHSPLFPLGFALLSHTRVKSHSFFFNFPFQK